MNQIHLRNICKTFPVDIRAVRNVSLEINSGRVYCLTGDNGAGKSTLMSILAGYQSPDSGSIFIDGVKTYLHSPHDALGKGIGMVYQDRHLVSEMTARENIALGNSRRLLLPASKRLASTLTNLNRRYGTSLDFSRQISRCTAFDKLLAAMYTILPHNPRLIILDEPGQTLAPEERQRFYTLLSRIKQDDIAIVIITHHPETVIMSADEMLHMRKGRIVSHSVGNAVRSAVTTHLSPSQQGTHSLRHREASSVFKVSTSLVELTLNPGDITGITSPNFRELHNLEQELFGRTGSAVLVCHGRSEPMNPTMLRRRGYALVPSDRNRFTAAPSLSTELNASTLAGRKGDFYFPRSIRRRNFRQLKTIFPFEAQPDQVFQQLSGGNRQRLILAREFSKRPPLFLGSDIAAGLDRSFQKELAKKIIDAASEGTAFLLLAEDPEFLFAVCERIYRLSDGELTEIPASEFGA